MFQKNYETVFILTPVLSEVQMKDTVDKFVNLLKTEGAEIINVENWGLKKLAYPIQKKSTGFYHLFEFTATSIDIISQLEIAYKRDERVLRFLTVSLDKHAIAYSEKRKGKFAEAKSKKKESANA